MGTGAKTAFGTKIYVGGTGTPKTGGALVEEVTTITLPEQVAEAINATSHDSAAGEYIPPGIVLNGQVTAEMLYKAATGQELVRANLNVAATQYYINLAGGQNQKQLDFLAFCTNWAWGAADAQGPDAIKATATIQISGGITLNTQA